MISYCGLALRHISIKESKGKEGVFVVLGGLLCIRTLYLKVKELGSAMYMCSVFKILVNFFKNLGLCLGKK